MTSQPSNDVKISVSAPGKVILHGEHSVVYGKLAIAASLGLRTRLNFQETPSADFVQIEFPALNLTQTVSFKDIIDLVKLPLPLLITSPVNHLNNPENVNHEDVLKTLEKLTFVQNLPPQQKMALMSFFCLYWAFASTVASGVLTAFKVRVESELSVSAGTGSSASFAVVVAAFLLRYVNIKNGKDSKCFAKDELEVISKWAFQSERIIHGTPSGVDNTICTYGGLVEFRKGTAPKLVEISTKFNLILINTKLPRDTKKLVNKAASKREKYPQIIDGVLDLMDQIAKKALHCMVTINASGDSIESNYESLGELADLNQNLLRCLGVSHVKLDEICAILEKWGLHGKLTGAGGGGYAICLVPPYFRQTTEVLHDLQSKGFEAILTDLGGCGVSLD